MIKLEHINYSYKNITALKDINLEIQDNECFVIMGNNGCGKSTLLKILNGLLYPTSGTYTLDNTIINKEYLENNQNSKSFHQHIGFIFQNADAQLFCPNVYEEIAFGPNQMNLSKEEVEQRVNDVCDLLEINHLKDRSPYELSGGEKRKVTIASVLSMNPDILVLDEPIASLDKKSQDFLLQLFLELKKTSKTMIITTHDETFAKKIADKIIIINDNHELDVGN